MKHLIYLLSFLGCLSGNPLCYSQEIRVVDLPDDLTELTGKDLKPVIQMLGNAKIIGVTECVHDMIEPFQFRNALIKELVLGNRIQVIAIESGFPESRLAYDYILGKDIDPEKVFTEGFSCIFGTLDPNQELIEWLREYNKGKEADKQVHFYGFDIPGCPPNPVYENALAGFHYVYDYLDKVDPAQAEYFRNTLGSYDPYLRIKDNAEDSLPHFWDLIPEHWSDIEDHLDVMDVAFERNPEEYIAASSMLDYAWAKQAVYNARQNVNFLRNLKNRSLDYDCRDHGQFKNIQWIIDQEKGKKVLLFAHSTHLMKEIHGGTSDFLPYPRCGEYLAEAYGEDYKVIGNFFRKLDYKENGTLELEEGYLGNELSVLGNNYIVDMNALDQVWDKEWSIRKSNSGNEILTILREAVDIIYFNDTQTTMFGKEND